MKDKYFNYGLFKKYLFRHKQAVEGEETRALLVAYAKPAPKGWSVQTFLEKIDGLGTEDEVTEIAQLFESWGDFIASTRADMREKGVPGSKTRRIAAHIGLFNAGVWPEDTFFDYIRNFQAKAPENQGRSFSSDDKKTLENLMKKYGVFGDPWLYIAHEMKRAPLEVQEQYEKQIRIPLNKTSECELTVTAASMPLLMNRYFMLDPSFLYIVPTQENFPTSDNNFALPKNFKKYRLPSN